MLKALFVLKMFKFSSRLFGHVRKWLDKRAKVNFKIYNVSDLQPTDCSVSQEVKANMQGNLGS